MHGKEPPATLEWNKTGLAFLQQQHYEQLVLPATPVLMLSQQSLLRNTPFIRQPCHNPCKYLYRIFQTQLHCDRPTASVNHLAASMQQHLLCTELPLSTTPSRPT
jgi:hypothetical protein